MMSKKYIFSICLSFLLIISFSCTKQKPVPPPVTPPAADPTKLKVSPEEQKKLDEEKKKNDAEKDKKMGGPIILEDGLEYEFSAIRTLTLEPVDYFVHMFKIKQDKLKLKIVSFQEDKAAYKNPQALREELNAKIVINAGFFSDLKTPNIADGLLMLEGKKISEPNPKLSGVLAIQENILSIIETDKFKMDALKPDTSAIQGNPRLIESNGEIGVEKPDLKTTKDSRQMRTAICILPDNDFLLMVTDRKKSGLYLYEMATVAKWKKCSMTINLDGGPATSISVKEYNHPMFKNLEIPAEAGWIHPNLIVIE